MSTENECAASKQATFFDTEAASEPVAASSPTVAESSSVAVASEASVSADSTPQVGIEEIFFYINCTENKSKYWKINKNLTFFRKDQSSELVRFLQVFKTSENQWNFKL